MPKMGKILQKRELYERFDTDIEPTVENITIGTDIIGLMTSLSKEIAILELQDDYRAANRALKKTKEITRYWKMFEARMRRISQQLKAEKAIRNKQIN